MKDCVTLLYQQKKQLSLCMARLIEAQHEELKENTPDLQSLDTLKDALGILSTAFKKLDSKIKQIN
jgi:hypothetical protein